MYVCWHSTNLLGTFTILSTRVHVYTYPGILVVRSTILYSNSKGEVPSVCGTAASHVVPDCWASFTPLFHSYIFVLRCLVYFQILNTRFIRRLHIFFCLVKYSCHNDWLLVGALQYISFYQHIWVWRVYKTFLPCFPTVPSLVKPTFDGCNVVESRSTQHEVFSAAPGTCFDFLAIQGRLQRKWCHGKEETG